MTEIPRPPARPKIIKKGSGLQAAELAAVVLEHGPIRPGGDGRLWAHVDGVWRPTGRDQTRRRVRTALGNAYRTTHLNNIVDWLKAEDPIDPAEPDPDIINVANGLLNWRTGELLPHTPDHGSTCQLPVMWNPDAECPENRKFLAQVLAPDAHDLMEEALGYLVMAGNPMHLAFLLLGGGRNGKGTLLRVIERLLGPNNVAAITPHQIADSRFAAANLYGMLANIAGDLEGRLIERTDTLKMLTGGDSIQAEHKFGHPFVFRNFATMLFSANTAPAVRDHSEGYYSRWLVIPFPNVIPVDKRLPQHVLDARLDSTAELEGLLVVAVNGLRRLMARGQFEQPDSVVEATQRFRLDTDPTAEWIEERTVQIDGGWSTVKDLYHDYEIWSFENGRRAVAASNLYSRIDGLDGVRRAKRHGGIRGFEGLLLEKPAWQIESVKAL